MKQPHRPSFARTKTCSRRFGGDTAPPRFCKVRSTPYQGAACQLASGQGLRYPSQGLAIC
eukprot:6178148-Pleurochrysis_carterae.AAC.2